MANCVRCGKPARFMSNICKDCFLADEAEAASKQSAAGAPSTQLNSGLSSATEESRSRNPRHTQGVDTRGSLVSCVFLGTIFLLIGAYFLLVEPGEGESLGRQFVNMHRLTLGQTSGIIGAIFLAAGIRPR